jgi:hypothetical protein
MKTENEDMEQKAVKMHTNKMPDISDSNVSQSLIRNILLCCTIKQFHFTEQERINTL